MKIAACIEYDGSLFSGWQLQDGQLTVQGAVESALSLVANHEVRVHCAGRTDTGVHACGQIIHFETDSNRSEYSWVMGSNANLPRGVGLIWAKEVHESFHARFKARARRYRYIILNRRIRPSYLASRVTWVPGKLNLQPMIESAGLLIGCHDFSAFRSAHCTNKIPEKNISLLEVSKQGNWFWIDIEADGFLHHMVRNIAGALFDVGVGKQDPSWISELLKCRDRSQGSITAPADGLYFVRATYDDIYELPPPPPVCRYW